MSALGCVMSEEFESVRGKLRYHAYKTHAVRTLCSIGAPSQVNLEVHREY